MGGPPDGGVALGLLTIVFLAVEREKYFKWTSPEGEQVCASAIITTEANETLKPIHDRMPVILGRDAVDLWLDPAVHKKEKLLRVLKPCPDDEIEMYEVSTRVNSPKNDTIENIERI